MYGTDIASEGLHIAEEVADPKFMLHPRLQQLPPDCPFNELMKPKAREVSVEQGWEMRVPSRRECGHWAGLPCLSFMHAHFLLHAWIYYMDCVQRVLFLDGQWQPCKAMAAIAWYLKMAKLTSCPGWMTIHL